MNTNLIDVRMFGNKISMEPNKCLYMKMCVRLFHVFECVYFPIYV